MSGIYARIKATEPVLRSTAGLHNGLNGKANGFQTTSEWYKLPVNDHGLLFHSTALQRGFVSFDSTAVGIR